MIPLLPWQKLAVEKASATDLLELLSLATIALEELEEHMKFCDKAQHWEERCTLQWMQAQYTAKLQELQPLEN